jgi:DnaJ-class molecular chaperone
MTSREPVSEVRPEAVPSCPDCGWSEQECRCYDDPDDDWDCTICGGDGTCDANADPLWDCDEVDHPCHACGGTGKRSAQRYM